MSMWIDYGVKIRFTTRLMAGVPADPNTLAAFLEVKGRPDLLEEVKAELPQGDDENGGPAEPEPVQKNVFKRDEQGRLIMEGYTWRAHLKDSGHVLAGMMKKTHALAAFRGKLADRLYVGTEHILIQHVADPTTQLDDPADWSPLTEPSGEETRGIRVQTPRGPRSAIKCAEFVQDARMQFTLLVLGDGVITEGLLRECFEYGAIHGYGSDRSLQRGQYAFEIERI